MRENQLRMTLARWLKRRVEHVPVSTKSNVLKVSSWRQTYHQWMQSPELLELTASEPLSYDEEIEMQSKLLAALPHITRRELTTPLGLSQMAPRRRQ